VVALYITRAPTPFVSKVAPPAAPDTGASQPQYDPNRPLQGKTPGQPVPQAAQPAPPNTAPGQTNAQTQSGMLEEPQIVEVPPSGNGAAVAPKPGAPAQGSGAVATKKPASAPSATSTASASGAKGTSGAATAKAAPPAPGDANTGYFLQVGAYKTQADAEQQRARLGFQGFESKVTERDAGGVTYYRVRIGPFTKFEDMNNVRQRLSDAGVDTAVIRFSKQ
jgi:cell division protein FtsN